MAYEPKTWVCGETITADGLNNIEEGIQEALECCESGGDCGYSCSEETVSKVYFDGNVTVVQGEYSTEALFPLSTPIEEGDYLSIILNGVEYELPKTYYYADDDYGYGDEDLITSPCFIMCDGDINEGYLFTPSEGTYSLKVQRETTVDVIETSECFEKAVREVSGYKCSLVKNEIYNNEFTPTLSDGKYVYTDGDVDTQVFPIILYVEFDDVEYVCKKSQYNVWGAQRVAPDYEYDWSEYPFSLYPYHGLVISTQNGGSHTIKISTGETVSEVDDCFKAASQQSNKLIVHLFQDSFSPPSYHTDKSFDEMRAAIDDGKDVVLINSGIYHRLVMDARSYLTFQSMHGYFNGASSKLQYFEFSINNAGVVTLKKMEISGIEQ